jgi:hypothetical protein
MWREDSENAKHPESTHSDVLYSELSEDLEVAHTQNGYRNDWRRHFM